MKTSPQENDVTSSSDDRPAPGVRWTRRGFLAATAATTAAVVAGPRLAFANTTSPGASPLLVSVRLGVSSGALGSLGSLEVGDRVARVALAAPAGARSKRSRERRDAWLLRYLEAASSAAGDEAYLPALAVGTAERGGPTSLSGSFETLSYTDRQAMARGSEVFSPALDGALREAVWALQTGESAVARSGIQALAAREVAEWLEAGPVYRPAGGARYPETEVGRHLAEIAEAARSDLGLQLATLEIAQSEALQEALTAFVADLDAGFSAPTVVVVEAAAGGELWLFGTSVRGGRYTAPTGEGARQRVLAEVVESLRGDELAAVTFPGFAPAGLGLLG